jgi:AMP phosphorylase
MQLKVKFLKLSAGKPVAVIHKKFGIKSSIHVDERILIRKNSKKIVAVVDIATGMLEENEMAVSKEVVLELGLLEGDYVGIEIAPKPESLSFISSKLNCTPLGNKEIKKIVEDIVEDALTESEIAYFISAVYKCGMSTQEIINMINAIVETGKRLILKSRFIVDKHSIGGIPGRTTPIVVSICSAAGLIMPKTSSRAITTPSGTADALETICKVDFTIPEIKRIVRKTGACMVWGGSLGLAPADDKIIQVERLINLDPEAQLITSIIAKKISVGSKFILIEIPYGKFAKVDKKRALVLKRRFESIGNFFHLKLKCLLIETQEPLGNGVGPALEIKDVISVLKQEDECFMLEKRALTIAAKILEMTGRAEKGKGMALASHILKSGQAFKKFKQIIEAQHGRIKKISEARFSRHITAPKNSKLKTINTKKINELARILGCPLDKNSGLYLYKHRGDKVMRGEKILTLYSESESEMKSGIKFYNKSLPIELK